MANMPNKINSKAEIKPSINKVVVLQKGNPVDPNSKKAEAFRDFAKAKATHRNPSNPGVPLENFFRPPKKF